MGKGGGGGEDDGGGDGCDDDWVEGVHNNRAITIVGTLSDGGGGRGRDDVDYYYCWSSLGGEDGTVDDGTGWEGVGKLCWLSG